MKYATAGLLVVLCAAACGVDRIQEPQLDPAMDMGGPDWDPNGIVVDGSTEVQPSFDPNGVVVDGSTEVHPGFDPNGND